MTAVVNGIFKIDYRNKQIVKINAQDHAHNKNKAFYLLCEEFFVHVLRPQRVILNKASDEGKWK